MAASPDWKVYDKDGKYIAACKDPHDAAAIVALRGDGATIRWGHRLIVWTEGQEGQSADNSYDYVDLLARKRLDEYWKSLR